MPSDLPGPWIEYQPKRERDKEYYDIELRDGTIVFCCYPNGVHWNPMFGAPRRAGKSPIPDYRVVRIRRCEHAIDHWLNPDYPRRIAELHARAPRNQP